MTSMSSDVPEYRFFLAGEWREGKPYTVACPYDGAPVGMVHRAGPAELEQAIQAAVKAFEATRKLPGHKRAAALRKISETIAARAEDLARTLALEAGKPIKQARVEIGRSVTTFATAAEEATRFHDEMLHLDALPGGENRPAIVRRFPIGPIAAISPFNFPLNLVAHKLAPAIAAGCPVVLKPASQTPLSAIALAELLLDECGLPPGHLSVVTGSGGSVGNAIVDDPDIALITFTGSPEVGWGIRARAPRKKVGLELGNNAPVILEPDGDLEGAARKISVAGFSHAGQSCISTQRVYVHEDVADKFLGELVPLVEALVVGDPLDEQTDVSTLISGDDTERVKAWIDEATAGGAHVACGGEVLNGVLMPTVLTDVEPDMKVCSLEVFGPVVAVQTYRELDDALRLANDTRYGLQAAIFTRDLATALRGGRELDFGGVLVNEVPTYRTDQMPYGGIRDSGNTREGPKYAVHEMTETRLVVIQA